MNYQTASEIEIAVAHYFGVRTHVIVPNVSYGLFGYELDLVVLNNNSFYAYEVEIKVSKADLKRDSQKYHNHDRNGGAIRLLYFAMPLKMKPCIDLVPERAGILFVDADGKVSLARAAKPEPGAHKWGLEQAFKLGRLGTLRIFDLKERVRRYKAELAALKAEKLLPCKWQVSWPDNRFFVPCIRQYIEIDLRFWSFYKICPGCGGEIIKPKREAKWKENEPHY
jgi:hypothetical protein